jgi:methyltransferase
MTLALVLIALVAVQRLIELAYSTHNTKKLIARGGIEVGRNHYPFIVALHASWLATIVLALPDDPPIHLVPLVLFLCLQAVRVWVIATLGSYWTTRIITIPGEPLIERGPYRFMRHPNYAVVSAEIAIFPLVFGEFWVAAIFWILNAVVLGWRIKIENAVLAPRR